MFAYDASMSTYLVQGPESNPLEIRREVLGAVVPDTTCCVCQKLFGFEWIGMSVGIGGFK